MKKVILFALPLLISLNSCHTNKPLQQATGSKISSQNANSLSEEAPKPQWAPAEGEYNYTHERKFDLLHTKLDVTPLFEKAQLEGKAWLTLRPYFYPQDELKLDAKGFDIEQVSLLEGTLEKSLAYEYDQRTLTITLPRSYKAQDTLTLYIQYTAKPEELNREGSAAITQAKGLYFINHDQADPLKPVQLWTQGETESSSCWFPTIDKPNERTTQEISITVVDSFITLSNGTLTNQKRNANGTRTDTWEMKLPHAPYLFMMAAGDFAIVKDTWRTIPVNYYVEKKYEPYASLVFGNTPEMLEFFSNKLGVTYPWSKYSQIVVRDFVSGAMENTSAVVHFDALQHDDRAHLDATYEDIIAHELFHHWFGDLVTCESWANLPLNESFATYGEYLWNEYKYGKDAADYGHAADLNVYLAESRRKREPLIRFFYENKEDMFDAHSYQKGGCVLHMLRNHVGDDAFFKSLQVYLKENEYQSVEIHNLRLAVEKVTGKDLNWFFDQWFFSPGHPEISVEEQYEPGKLTLKVKQTQNLEYMPIYRLPVTIEVVNGSDRKSYEVEITSSDTTFSFPASQKPEYVVFDANKILLAKINFQKPTSAWTAQLLSGKNYRQKREALDVLISSMDKPAVFRATSKLLNDSFDKLRKASLEALQYHYGDLKITLLEKVAGLALDDPEAEVRGAAIKYLKSIRTTTETQKDIIISTLKAATKDRSYATQAAALEALYAIDKTSGKERAEALKEETNPSLSGVLLRIYRNEASSAYFPFFEKVYRETDGMLNRYILVAELTQGNEVQENEWQNKYALLLVRLAQSESNWTLEKLISSGLSNYTALPEIQKFIEAKIATSEKEEVKQHYQSLLKNTKGE